MDSNQFRDFGKAMVDYIADYYDNIRDRNVLPAVEPGYLRSMIPNEAPQQGENWTDVLKDVERVVMPGVTHWHSPQFHAYYPTASSFPAIVGEMLSAGIGCIGFSWMTSPACTELEVEMMNWLGKILNLPEEFLNSSEGPGGGVIQSSASDATFVALLAAKDKIVRKMMKEDPSLTEGEIKAKLVAYTSDQANSSVEKAGILASVPMIHLKSDNQQRLTGATLLEAVRRDRAAGLIPCYVVATLGTTGTCAFDDLEDLGPICQKEGLWLHVDAAYAGSAFVCPEYQYLMKGVEYCDSFDINPHKWLLINFDCSTMWVKDSRDLIQAFNVDRIYLKHKHEGYAPDYRHWQVPLGRRFRALKMWFVMRIYGVEGLQQHIRKQVSLAKYFEKLVLSDSRFELLTSSMGLVCFRLRAGEEATNKLLEKINERKNIYIVPGHYDHEIAVRFAICSRFTEVTDVDHAWNEFCSVTDSIVITSNGIHKENLTNSFIEEKCNKPSLQLTSQRCFNGKENGIESLEKHK